MRKLASLLSVAILLVLSACTSPQKQLETAAANAETQKSHVQELADRITGEVIGAENRSLRLCMAVAGVSELMVWRVTRYDPDDATTALGHLAALRGVQARFDQADEVWFETDMRLAQVTIVGVLSSVTKERVGDLAANFLGGVSVSGLTTSAKVVAAQTAIAEAIIRDIRNLFARISTGDITPEQGRAACENRLAANEARISALLGVVGRPSI